MPNKGPPPFVSDLKRTALPPPPPTPQGRRQVLRVEGGGGGKGANYGWGFRPGIRQAGGGGLIMVGGLVPRYDSGGGGEVYTSGTIRKAGGGGVA